jgi:hypothetical protein
MAAILELDRFGELPLWAQVLAATRMVRRAALALHDLRDGPTVALVEESCAALERSATAGDIVGSDLSQLELAKALRDHSGPGATVGEALWWAIDAAGAAQAAQDFPVDATVTNSAFNAIRTIAADDRFNALQVRIVLAADFDLLRFASQKSGVGTYDGLKAAVGNLPPVHGLTSRETGIRQP